jgi:hypothetical protein
MQQQNQMNSMNSMRQQQTYMQHPSQTQILGQTNHYQQDQQMVNQTRDQMLLQAPNQLMSQNPNQQINPADKLSQVVDNL